MKGPIPSIGGALLCSIILAAFFCPFRPVDFDKTVYMPFLWNGVRQIDPKGYSEVEREYQGFRQRYPKDLTSLPDFAYQMDLVQNAGNRRTAALQVQLFKRDTESFLLILGLLVTIGSVALVSVVLHQREIFRQQSVLVSSPQDEQRQLVFSPISLLVCVAMSIPALLAAKLMTNGFFIPAVEGFYQGARLERDGVYDFITQVLSCTAAGFVFVFVGTLAPRELRRFSVWGFAVLAVAGGWFVVADTSMAGFFGQSYGAIAAAILVWKKSTGEKPALVLNQPPSSP